jgi:hypothetical protein
MLLNLTKVVTYLIYIIFFLSMTIGGTGYVVFVMGNSPWWFVLGFIFSLGYTRPAEWEMLTKSKNEL